LGIFRKSVEKTEVSFKVDNSHEGQYTFLILSRSCLQTKVVEEIKTNILCSATFFSKIAPFMRYCGKAL